MLTMCCNKPRQQVLGGGRGWYGLGQGQQTLDPQGGCGPGLLVRGGRGREGAVRSGLANPRATAKQRGAAQTEQCSKHGSTAGGSADQGRRGSGHAQHLVMSGSSVGWGRTIPISPKDFYVMAKERVMAPLPAVQAEVAAAVEQHGLVLEELSVRPAGDRRVLRVVVNSQDERVPSPTLDDIAALSRQISVTLDETEMANGPAYVLEVSSAGVDRPLTTPSHFRRNLRRTMVLTLATGEPVTGRLLEIEGTDPPQSLLLAVAGAKRGTTTEVQVPWDQVRQARVEVEFRALDQADPAEEKTE